jgi:N-acetylglutamate synthase-like GNAT family acetyltransferase
MTDIEQITQELTWQLRRDVLYPGGYKHNMAMPEDDLGTHFGAFYDGKLAGVVSLFNEGDNFQFRKFAIAVDMQQKGIGTQLLNYITAHAMDKGGKRLWCNARTTAVGFYAKHGLKKIGDIFNKGEHEYVMMEKSI